jgi:hypothetical protein
MRTIIAGGRNFNNRAFMEQSLVDLDITAVVGGKARGADTLGEEWALANGIPFYGFPAKWDVYGKSAGYKRNVEMANNADALVAFWDGSSKGTAHMISIATQKGLRVRVVTYSARQAL